MNKTPIFAIALSLLAGCAPSIQNFTVTPGEPGEELPVSATINKQQTIIDGVTLQIRPVGGSFTNSGSLGNSGATYTGTTPRQGPGEYEARLSVEYRPALTAASKTKTSGIRPYTLAWPAGTFGFEQGNPGWYLNGVLNVADDFNGCGIDQLNASPYFHYTSAGWPLGIGYVNPGFPAGALRVGISAVCYPDQVSELDGTNVFWGIELVSTSVENDPNWQGIDGVSFRAISTFDGIQVVPMLEVIDGDSSTWVAPVQNGDPDFSVVGGNWTVIEKTGFVPDGATIGRVMVRVFGLADNVEIGLAYELLLDVVSPIPAN